MKNYKVLSIDAWRDENGWFWNDWHNAGDISLDLNSSNRQILKTMRDSGFLTDYSKGRVAVDDDQYNIVILDKNTREPLFAIEYGNTI